MAPFLCLGDPGLRYPGAPARSVPTIVRESTASARRGKRDERPGPLAGARAAAARRRGARERDGGVRPPDLVHVRRRPRSGAARGALPLRLRRPEEPGERPARLLEVPRVAARLPALPRRPRAVGGGGRHVPAVRPPAPRPPPPR